MRRFYRNLLGRTCRHQSTAAFDANSTLVKTRQFDNTGHFSAFVTDQLSVANIPNGGLLMAMAIGAAKEMVTFPEPLTVTGHYVNKALENTPAEIIVTILNVSKSSATVEMKLLQENVLRCSFLGTFGNIAAMRGMNYSNLVAPQLPPVEECGDIGEVLRKGMGLNVTLFNETSLRFAKDSEFYNGVMKGKVGATPAFECWSRFSDFNRKACTRSLAYFLDAIPPPILILAPTNWVPTLEYTVNFFNAPNPCPCKNSSANQHEKHPSKPDHNAGGAKHGSDWLRLRMTVPYVHNGLLYEDGEAWSEDGKTLLATSRQLARVLQPSKSK